MVSNTDKDLIKLMEHASESFCDQAINKWSSGQYTKNQKEISANIFLWKEKKNRISELCEMLMDSF